MIPVTALVLLLISLVPFGTAATAQLDRCPLPPSFIIPTQNVCDNLLLTIPGNIFSCAVITGVEKIASAVSPLKCRTNGLVTPAVTDAKGRPIPQPLSDRRWPLQQLPNRLRDVNTVLQAEGGTYYWHYRNYLNLFNWAPCQSLGSNVPLPIPAGWSNIATLNLPQGQSAIPVGAASSATSNSTGNPATPVTEASSTDGPASMPFAVVLKADVMSSAERQKSCQEYAAAPETLLAKTNSNIEDLCGGDQLVVIVRGTLSAYEWTLDLTYSHVTDANYGPGAFHAGFHHVALTLWPQLEPILLQQLVEGDGSVRQLVVTGHSLGAGVAQLLATRAQRFLAAQTAKQPLWQTWPNKQPLVTAMLFAAPNVGTKPFVNWFNKNINARLLAFRPDVVPQLPCDPRVIACPASAGVAVPTPNPAGIWAYENAGGNIVFEASNMPFDQLSNSKRDWESLKVLTAGDFCDAGGAGRLFFARSHICSYICWTSQFVSETNNWCLFQADTSVTGATVCDW